jgi:hypothetical protein
VVVQHGIVSLANIYIHTHTQIIFLFVGGRHMGVVVSTGFSAEKTDLVWFFLYQIEDRDGRDHP